MKLRLLFLPLLISSCASQSSSSGPSDREREDMERKMIGFQEKFDRFDHNGDGFLTRTELSNGLKFEKVEGITTEQVPKIFQLYDLNKDGRISLKETNAVYEAGPDAALRLQAAP